jgi:two-component system response regulator VicR
MKKRILYVEDDEDTGNLVKMVLGMEGYDVEVVSNGYDCLSSVAKKTPDLLMLDMMLPDMSGWDIFNKIKSDSSPLVKVMFLSVVSMPDGHVSKLKEHWVMDYVLKPFDNEDRVKRISMYK